MKPLLTAVTCALSFVALTGSIPASAQTITVDGVWFGTTMFFDVPGFGFAYITSPVTTPDAPPGSDVYSLVTHQDGIPSEAPDYDFFHYRRDTRGTQSAQSYRLTYQEKVVGHVGDTSDIGKEIQIHEYIHADEYYYSYTENSTQKIPGGRRSFDWYESSDPAFGIAAYASFPYSGIGIFDFEQSYIYYANGSSISLADYMRQSFNAPLTEAGSYQVLSFDTRNESIFTFRWFDGNEVAGMTLAYNPIPEPETWAMLLAGLGIVGAVARRQRIKQ